uniref:Uncharacterized protein n=1 Tax=Romanomermis culicivorax TaxID=13658 RepID=A0A915KMM3_ROMCU
MPTGSLVKATTEFIELMMKFVRSKLKTNNNHDYPQSEHATTNQQINSSSVGNQSRLKHERFMYNLENQVYELQSENDHLHKIIREIKTENETLKQRLASIMDEKAQQKSENQEVQRILGENLHWKKCVDLEKAHAISLEEKYKQEIERYSEEKKKLSMEKCSFEEQLAKISIIYEENKLKLEILENEYKKKIRPEEFEDIFRISELNLEKLKTNYKSEIEDLTQKLCKCESEMRKLALKYSELERQNLIINDQKENTSAALKKYKIENEELIDRLNGNEQKMIELIKLIDDLTKCLTEEKRKNDEQKKITENLDKKLTMKLGVCRSLAQENRRLKECSVVAYNKLKKARTFLRREERSTSSLSNSD